MGKKGDGGRAGGQGGAAEAYELDVDAHAHAVDPAGYGVAGFAAIRPRDYFITSGDAVIKATHLDRDAWRAAGLARQLYGASVDAEEQRFCRDMWVFAGRCRALLNLLKKVRGGNVFLETCWEDRRLMCVAKNPRKREAE